MGYNQLINGVYWGYNPFPNHLLTSWDIQVYHFFTGCLDNHWSGKGYVPPTFFGVHRFFWLIWCRCECDGGMIHIVSVEA